MDRMIYEKYITCPSCACIRTQFDQSIQILDKCAICSTPHKFSIVRFHESVIKQAIQGAIVIWSTIINIRQIGQIVGLLPDSIKV